MSQGNLHSSELESLEVSGNDLSLSEVSITEHGARSCEVTRDGTG